MENIWLPTLMQSLGELLKDFKVAPGPVHKPSLPRPTPVPEKNKVIGEPTRFPVNKQAALLISPMRCWLSQPLPEYSPLPTRAQKQIAQLVNTLKMERNAHALTRDTLGKVRAELIGARAMISDLLRRVDTLQSELKAQASTINQLEDLRL